MSRSEEPGAERAPHGVLGESRQREPRATTPVAVGRRPGTPSIVYQAAGRGWSIWWPCLDCGGAELPVRSRHPHLDTHGSCPGCETRRRRLEPGGLDPAVWYDTRLGDWAVRVPCPGLRWGAVFPLGIRWFDASWAVIYRAAADVAYGAAELESPSAL